MKITINEKEYELQWGMGALEIYCDNMLCDIEGLNLVLEKNREQNRAVITLILAAIQNGLELQNPPQELDVNARQVQKFLDDAPETTFPAIMSDFMKSKYFGTTIEEYILMTLQNDEGTEEGAPKKKSDSPK